MERNETWKGSFISLGQSIDRLKDALNAYETCPEQYKEYIRDSCIKRFVFSADRYWKTLKKILYSKYINTEFPLDVFRKSFQYELIDDESIWIMILHDSNEISHNYQEKLAQELLENIMIYQRVMSDTYQKISNYLIHAT